MATIRISQSLIKDLIDYSEGNACGRQIQEKYINNNFDLFRSSTAKDLGTWFEYECTGSTPKGGQIPYPQKTRKGELTAPYAKLLPHISNFKTMMAAYGLHILEVGLKVIVGECEGTYDILALCTKDLYGWVNGEKTLIAKKGQRVIIDIKTSGLLDNKWDEHGWDLSRLEQKVKLVLQPVHYIYLGELKWKERLPFLFFLFNTKSSDDFRIIHFNVDDEEIELHKKNIINVKNWIIHHEKVGWRCVPTTERCRKCPKLLKLPCEDFAAVPPITTFNYSSANK